MSFLSLHCLKRGNGLKAKYKFVREEQTMSSLETKVSRPCMKSALFYSTSHRKMNS